MTDEIGMWKIGDGSQAELVPPTDRASTEQLLEDVLTSNPDMLLPSLTLVGRQAPTDSGYLDLVGLDSDGKLVVFELKRGTLTRDAVAQVLDYGSYLESLPDLGDYIVRQGGKNGIGQIDDFEAWYNERFDEQEIILKPVRMVLVGLGVDGKAKRMVEFLQERGVDIDLITFHGFLHQGQTLLIKQVEIPEVSEGNSGSRFRRRRMSKAEHWDQILNFAKERNAGHLEEATETLRHEARYYHTEYGTTFINPRIVLPKEVPARASHSVVLDRNSSGTIKVVFYPPSVHLCWNEFQEERDKISFEFEKPQNTNPTERVSEQWYCQLDAEGWRKHGEALQALAWKVQQEWKRVRGEQSQNDASGLA